ncbi:hypothetical protein [Euzebya tangerina]|uniref:hypothetical protein n=1 Tax=Euzebya tangerina TaxID=591198 RepID=UPI000E31C230|nr:hypothetical protein [Euzebya tangerina]
MSSTAQTSSDPSPRERLRALSPLHRAKLLFMVAGFVSLVLSVSLWATGNETEAIFVGLWVPSVHSLGTLVLTGERFDRDE